MIQGFDIGIVINKTLRKIFEFAVILIFCTDLKSFYDCLVKLGTI